MFSRQRKARVLFGVSDLILTTLAFEAAYQTRVPLHLHFVFFLSPEQKALLLGFSLLAWITLGVWLSVYEKLDAGHPRVILRDAARQCAGGALALVVFEYFLRMDLSRSFVVLFACFAWTALVLFRLTAGRLVGVIRREFAGPHYVMVVGTGERARHLAEALERSVDYGIRLRGFLSDEPLTRPAEILLETYYPVRPIADLPAILRQNVIDEIIFAVQSERLSELEEYFLLCDEEG